MNSLHFISILLLFVLSISMVNNATAQTSVTIEIGTDALNEECAETENGCYNPSTVTVDVGGTITMTNTDDTEFHTFTSGTEDEKSSLFHSGGLFPGDSFEYSPDIAGEIPYFCGVHPWMTGLIIVEEIEPSEISLQTDEESYTEGDTIVISGLVTNTVNGDIVFLEITNDNNIVESFEISLDEDGRFTKSFVPDITVWEEEGQYVATLTFNNLESQIFFVFSHKTEEGGGSFTGKTTSTTLLSNQNNSDEKFVYVWTNKSEYNHHEILLIKGYLYNADDGSSVVLDVIDPSGISIIKKSLLVDGEGNFEIILNIADAIWNNDGKYRVTVNYDTATKSNITEFILIGGKEKHPSSFTAALPISPKLTDTDIHQFEKTIRKWNALINNFERNADKFESKGDLVKSEYLHYKANIFKSLIEYLKELVR